MEYLQGWHFLLPSCLNTHFLSEGSPRNIAEHKPTGSQHVLMPRCACASTALCKSAIKGPAEIPPGSAVRLYMYSRAPRSSEKINTLKTPSAGQREVRIQREYLFYTESSRTSIGAYLRMQQNANCKKQRLSFRGTDRHTLPLFLVF